MRLKDSPSRELNNLEFTVLVYLCLGATNEGIAWLMGASRQSVERILTGMYRKLGIPMRRETPKGVPAFLESRTRLCYEAMIRGWIDPNLLREEDAALRERVKGDLPLHDRFHVSMKWLEKKV
jgi:DNA-binding CsgD family transcriptional regulator